jgi:hypothetical protein
MRPRRGRNRAGHSSSSDDATRYHAASPDEWYPPGSSSEEWDYGGLQDAEALRWFLNSVDYCFNVSSEGEGDPVLECFVIDGEVKSGSKDGAGDDASQNKTPVGSGAAREQPPANANAAAPANPNTATPPGEEALAQAQLVQVKELEERLQEERRQVQQLRAALEAQRPQRGERARAASQTAHTRIANNDVDLPRASQKLVAVVMLLRAIPEPSTPSARLLHREARDLVD